jgi:hypothetical protein
MVAILLLLGLATLARAEVSCEECVEATSKLKPNS